MVNTEATDTRFYEHQETGLLVQAAPVQNQWYIIFNEANPLGIRVYFVDVGVLTANETLEVRAEIDGVVTGSVGFAATFGDAVRAYWPVSPTAENIGLSLTANIIYPGLAFFCEGKEISIEMRKTTAAGAGNLEGKVSWAVHI